MTQDPLPLGPDAGLITPGPVAGPKKLSYDEGPERIEF
jgi:hypothetical protein